MSTTNNNLSDFLSFHSSSSSSSSSSSDDNINVGHDALDQLLESKLGKELTRSAQKLERIHTDNTSDQNRILLEEEVAQLMDSAAFQQMNAQIIQECPLSLLFPSTHGTAAAVENRREDDDTNITVVGSNKKSREEASATTTNKPPEAAGGATSFSLFDLMDSQKGAFTIPPRIMAQQVIDADQRDNTIAMNNSNDGTITNAVSRSFNNDDSTTQATKNKNNNNNESALELLEQAEDMEDLSPDVQSWEQIQSILYRGLMNTTNLEERRRYFKVHKSIFDKCQRNIRGGGGGGGMFRSQSWGLTLNIVGLILSLSNNEFDNMNDGQRTDLDLYWDSCHHLLSSLSRLAVEYCTSSVGNEKEMERMILGLCSILCSDVSSCVLAMMEPMAGWFEVWARFVGPSRLMVILRVSGLGDVVLRRCESRGRNEASERLHGMLRQRAVSSVVLPTLKDLEESNFLQSLSILRVIVSRCGAAWGSTGSIFSCHTSTSSFLSADGIITFDEVQAMLGTKPQSLSVEEQKKITTRVVQPFLDIILLAESTPGLVDAELEELCTQTVSLIQQQGWFYVYRC
eukprot:scaffold6619_cov146-Skeletonema_menzelii.AAC.5